MLMPESCSEDKDVVETRRHKAGIELITCLGIQWEEVQGTEPG